MESDGLICDQSELGNVGVWVGSVWERRGWGVGDRQEEAGASQPRPDRRCSSFSPYKDNPDELASHLNSTFQLHKTD